MELLYKNKSGMISKEGFLEAQKYIYFNKKKGLRLFYLLGGILLILGGTACLIAEDYIFMLIFYLIGVFYLFSFKNYYKLAAGKIYLRAMRLAQGEYEWLFYDNRAVRKTAEGEIELDYNKIKDVFETADDIILYAKGTIYWVDKGGFENGSYSGFVDFLTERCKTDR